MATSIAKLAVLITGDTTSLAQATTRGEQIIQRFERRTASTSLTGRTGLGQSLLLGVGGGGASRLLQLFGRAGPIAIGALSLAAFAKAGVSAASSIEELRMEVQRLQDELDGVTRKSEEFADTASGQWERLKQATGDLSFTVTGGKVASGLNQVLSSFSDLFEQISASGLFDRFGAEQGAKSAIAAERERLKIAKERLQAELETSKQIAEEERKAAEQKRREMDRLKSRAESIEQSLRTPHEIFRDTVAELQGLDAAGLFGSIETFQRGVRAAVNDLMDATRKTAEFKSAGMVAPAAEMGTQAARSAILDAKAETKRMADIAAEDKKLSEERNRLIADTNRSIKAQPTVVLTKGEL